MESNSLFSQSLARSKCYFFIFDRSFSLVVIIYAISNYINILYMEVQPLSIKLVQA